MNVRKNKLYSCTTDFRRTNVIYNAITQNHHEIDRVHKNAPYIVTVSIKQKAVDRIKTGCGFG